MMLCTKIRANFTREPDGTLVIDHAADRDIEIADVSVVDDGHQFGLDPEGWLHIRGEMTVAPRA